MVRSDVGHPLPEGPEPVARYEVLRFSSGDESTLGLLFELRDGRRHFLAFTLEDEGRTEKVRGETRIPAGTYDLQLRTEGGFHTRYTQKFPDIHEGMIHVQDVPGFKWILWHLGNDDDDTMGCLLVADRSYQNITDEGRIPSSKTAYRRIYPGIRDNIKKGRTVVTYLDYDASPEQLEAA
jgi:hypothetical protein